MSIFELEKAEWTAADFNAMGWHDCHIHSIAFVPQTWSLLLDIDYIFGWVDPQPPDKYFKFWIAPATLAFENIHSVKMDLESECGDIEIAELTRGKPRDTPNGKMKEMQYRFECQEGVLEFWATGFEMVTRKAPILRSAQSLDLGERDGICFDRVPFAT